VEYVYQISLPLVGRVREGEIFRQLSVLIIQIIKHRKIFIVLIGKNFALGLKIFFQVFMPV